MKHKNLFVGIFFGLVVFFSFGQAEPKSSIEAGTVPDSRFINSAAIGHDFSDIFYTQIEFCIPFPFFTYAFIEGGVETLLSFNERLEGWPIVDTYLIGLGIQFQNLTLGIRHECSHPVLSQGWALLGNEHAGGAYTKMYIKYDFKLFQ